MEEVLKQILNKLDIMGKDINDLKTNVTRLEDGQRKLEKKINDNLELVIEEQHRIYNSLDGKLDKVLEHIKSHEIRISALEARI